MFCSLTLIISLLILPSKSLLTRHYACREWVLLLAMKCLLEDLVETKIYCFRDKEVCLSKIIYLVQGHTESLLQCVVGKVTLALQMWLGNMPQILVMSIFNYLGLAWVRYSKSFRTMVLLIIQQLSISNDLIIEYYLIKDNKNDQNKGLFNTHNWILQLLIKLNIDYWLSEMENTVTLTEEKAERNELRLFINCLKVGILENSQVSTSGNRVLMLLGQAHVSVQNGHDRHGNSFQVLFCTIFFSPKLQSRTSHFPGLSSV